MKYYLKVHNFLSHSAYVSLIEVHLNRVNNCSHKTLASMCAYPKQECINHLSLVRSTKKWLSDTRYNMSIKPNL